MGASRFDSILPALKLIGFFVTAGNPVSIVVERMRHVQLSHLGRDRSKHAWDNVSRSGLFQLVMTGRDA
jgi:hypothetical protein